MASTEPSKEPKLAERVQRLPQELQDIIESWTFTLPNSRTVMIDSGYTPPSILRVDRATRSKLAAEYYDTNNTRFRELGGLAFKWLDSLSIEHKSRIQFITTKCGIPLMRDAIPSMQSLHSIQNVPSSNHACSWGNMTFWRSGHGGWCAN